MAPSKDNLGNLCTCMHNSASYSHQHDNFGNISSFLFIHLIAAAIATTQQKMA